MLGKFFQVTVFTALACLLGVVLTLVAIAAWQNIWFALGVFVVILVWTIVYAVCNKYNFWVLC